MKRFFTALFLLLFTLGVIGLMTAGMLVYWGSRDLPNFTRVADYRLPQATTVLARDGLQMGIIYQEKRFFVGLDRMAPMLPKAFLAAEDDAFYRHEGVDPIAIFRAFLVNMRSGEYRQGGSTITQQMVKRMLLSSERSLQRKIKEAILAYRLERYFTKDEILTLYLNEIFLGANAYGVEAAARTFFGKHAADLSIAECAVLGGMPQAPTRYNPYRDPEATRARQEYVLGRLRTLNWITEAEYQAALAEKLVYKMMPESFADGAWYLEEVRRQLIEMFSEANMQRMGIESSAYGEDYVARAGLTVQTAMVPEMQVAAVSALRQGLVMATKRHGWRGPLEKRASGAYQSFLENHTFVPESLANGKWVQALVMEVSEKGAKVRLGAYQGFIDVRTMSWARVPNVKIAAAYAPSIKDARKVLAAGDVVWVSWAVPAPVKEAKTRQGTPAPVPLAAQFMPEKITSDTLIPLALEQYPDIQGALVSMEPETGDVVAMAGGYSFADSQFNRATQAKRQPGSSFKPVIYSAALDKGFTTASILMDAPFVDINQYTDQIWRPSNFENNYSGPLLLRTALVKSKNLCTVRLAQSIGIPAVIERAKALGLTSHFPNELSVSLGAVEVSPLNLTQAYTAFANQGLVSTPRFILSIKDANGMLIYEQLPEHKEALSPQTAYIMANLLQAVVTSGTGSKARAVGYPVAGKTGTSNDENDAWFLGFTPHLVTGTYIGYDMRRPMGRFETGGNAATPIFALYGKDIAALYPHDEFEVPPGITFVTVDGKTGALAGAGSAESYTLPFVSGTQPTTGESVAPGGTGGSAQEELLKQLF